MATTAPARQVVKIPGRTSRVRLPHPGRLVRIVTLVVIVLLFALPIIWMLVMSFKPTSEIIADAVPVSLRSVVPSHPTFNNYRTIFSQYGFGTNLLNSALITGLGVVGSVVTSTLAGFGFARLRFRGRNLFFFVCMVAAAVPSEAIFLPELRLVSTLGLNDSYPGAILPFMFSPFAIFLSRQAFLDLPDELFEAARIDGAGVWRSLLFIGLPNIRATLATVTLVQTIWAWNAYLWPLVVLQDPAKQTAQVAAATFQSVPNHPLNGEFMAALTITSIPLVIITVFLQKYYVRGFLMSGSKG